MASEALGILEVTGFTPAMAALDAMEKAAGVRLVQAESNDWLGMVLKVKGDVSAVASATEAGKEVTFDRILMVNNDGSVRLGTPTVAGATVIADVVEHKRGDKVIVFKFKRRKGYHKKQGHRQELTVVQIKSING